MPKKKYWMQKAFQESHKGRLHRALGIDEKATIPQHMLQAAANHPGHIGKMARAALNANK